MQHAEESTGVPRVLGKFSDTFVGLLAKGSFRLPKNGYCQRDQPANEDVPIAREKAEFFLNAFAALTAYLCASPGWSRTC